MFILIKRQVKVKLREKNVTLRMIDQRTNLFIDPRARVNPRRLGFFFVRRKLHTTTVTTVYAHGYNTLAL